jgi:nucleotide-binding universal stress UspA family protein
MFAIRTILYPTDFSEPSTWAFRLACSLACHHDARFVALHVAPPPVHGMAWAHVEDYDQRWKSLHLLRPADLEVRLEHQLRHGDPVTEILRLARGIQSDLIVMGTHGRSGVSRLLMGSVAEAVVRRAFCPAITVKAPFPESTLLSVEELERQVAGLAH